MESEKRSKVAQCVSEIETHAREIGQSKRMDDENLTLKIT